jgi:long-chain acyl-CoA synthetase
MEMIVFLVAMSAGSQVGFWRGDTMLLVEDFAALRPTVLVGVPRVFNRIYDRINAQISQASLVKRQLFSYAYSAKLAALRESGELHHALWDRLVFSKISAVVGGRVRVILSGSAPLSPAVQDFLRIVFACPVVQGYGLTETTAALSVQDLGDTSSGNVGAPAVCTEVKLVDVPEMGYTSSGPGVQQGEICARGPSIFRGYYKMPEKTAEDIDRDGWFHSGDIGEWLPNGALKIIDRKKNIFKLAQGEYVAAEYLETIYLKSRFVAQVFVYGDSLRSCLVGVVVPDVDVLLPWAKKQGFPENLAELCKDERARKAVLASMMKVAQDSNLKGFEKVKAIHLEPVPWAPENLLTPTMKMRRADAKKHYAPVLERLYGEVKPDAKL